MRNWKRLLGIALLAILIWYFFLKQEHYQVRFTTSQPPGVVYGHIETWHEFIDEDSVKVNFNSGNRYNAINQYVVTDVDSLNFDWQIRRLSDTITEVKALITDDSHYWKRKFEVPFDIGSFVSKNVARVEKVGKELLKNGETFRVHSFNDTLVPSTFCAYRSAENIAVHQKSRKMLDEIQVIMEYIKFYDIPLAGDPFLEVTRWDQENNVIDFNFCFPIKASDSLPPSEKVLFKTTEADQYLKTEYNGNYRVSDQAWYYLMDYAEQNSLKVDPLPTEIYLTDPHQGGNILDWKAHILVPLK